MKISVLVNTILKKGGYEIIKTSTPVSVDFEEEFNLLLEQYKPYTMTSPERMYGLYKAVQYVSQNKLEGDFVECGVWRGGSAMVMAKTLALNKDLDRKFFLYDTYEGMTKPSEKDVSFQGHSGDVDWEKNQKSTHNDWCYAPYEEVKKNMESTGYPSDRISLIKGKVEDTIPATVPDKISLLRLDTDWYESTMHELVHLYPRLVKNGILIIDDYGHWKGAREAVDQYFAEKNVKPMLFRMDYAGRMMIKTE